MPQATTAQRIKGQEVVVQIIRAGKLEAELTDIQGFNVEDMFEIKAEGYLGETTNRQDYLYNGTKGDLEMHLHSKDWFLFRKAMRDKARRITPNVEFNIIATLNFPNGDTPTITLPNVSFGALPHNIPSRGEYVKVKLDFACDADDTDTQLEISDTRRRRRNT